MINLFVASIAFVALAVASPPFPRSTPITSIAAPLEPRYYRTDILTTETQTVTLPWTTQTVLFPHPTRAPDAPKRNIYGYQDLSCRGETEDILGCRTICRCVKKNGKWVVGDYKYDNIWMAVFDELCTNMKGGSCSCVSSIA